MKNSCLISSYCSIQRKGARIGKDIVYSDGDIGFRELANGIYTKFALNYPKFHKMDNLCKLGFLTVELLLRDRDLKLKYSGDEAGIIFMNASSSLDSDRRHQETISGRENYFPTPSVFVYTLPNVVIGEICIRHKFYGEGNFLISEKFNPDFLVNYVEQLFLSDIIQFCITGWIEFNGNDFESLVFLIEKPGRTENGIANFEPDIIRSIYEKIK